MFCNVRETRSIDISSVQRKRELIYATKDYCDDDDAREDLERDTLRRAS